MLKTVESQKVQSHNVDCHSRGKQCPDGEGLIQWRDLLGAADGIVGIAGLRDISLAPGAGIVQRVCKAPEVFYVAAGSGSLYRGEQTLAVEEGFFSLAAAGLSHGIKNTGKDELQLIAIEVSPEAETAGATRSGGAYVDLPECHEGIGNLQFRNVASDIPGIEFFHDDIMPPGVTIGYHRHEHPEIYYVADGDAVLQWDGEDIEAGPGHISLVRPGHSHGIENRSDAEVRLFVLGLP
jgi:mannose-6-phosphate isomerase-like protein (cupin superfamily)